MADDRRLTKLEAGFQARGQLRNQFSQNQLQDLYDKNFSKSAYDKGEGTIANYSMLKPKIANSRVTGTHVGRALIETSSDGHHQAISLDRVLQNERATMLFYAFATIRLVNEGILFWNAVEAFQNMKWKPNRVLGIAGFSKRDMRDQAKYIFTEFLDENAPTENCVPSDMLDQLRKQIYYEDNIHEALFVDAQRHVFRDMEKGLFREFLSSLNHRGLELVMKSLKTKSAPGLATATAICMSHRRDHSDALNEEDECDAFEEKKSSD
mmetsp:Transcript_21114/g.37038  ORF Transcript_21114/g.37038 Transcript_21114/m.37038 type:complete len:266 (-) Transcript_21114:144-941(-)|eukprot:CAMPEP_0171499932 /NCGR_PEP_ID=MMETSP0958-20121227/8703_1 /TAXON_ID=87120 /ORGANISM="Aurantiochytrium limacinum, Strain ATCCMYA-1381" /LENGTH=265 /DNA_ID=CAMNT_0012034543 /DNA_START=114 /DNA_END=911 /DNA_ORIENTATION=+